MDYRSYQRVKDQKNSTLLISPINNNSNQKVIFNQFSKHGNIISFQYIPKINSVIIQYQTDSQANIALLSLNGKWIAGQKIYVSYFIEKKNSQKSNTQFILFVKNVPSFISEEYLLGLIESEFGNVLELKLKKKQGKETEKAHLGYGHVEFMNEEDLKQMLLQQKNEGQIKFKKYAFPIQVETIKDKKNYTKQNRIHIAGFFEDEIQESEIAQKQMEIQSVLKKLKESFSDLNKFTFFLEYNRQKKNFWALIEFLYSTSEEEEDIYEKVRSRVSSNFDYKGSLEGPVISFTPKEPNQQFIFVLGILEYIDERQLASWLKVVLGITVSENSISIKEIAPKNFSSSSQYSALIHFESKHDSQFFQKFCSLKRNRDALDQILEERFKVSIYQNQSGLSKIQETSHHQKSFQKNYSNNLKQYPKSYDFKQSSSFVLANTAVDSLNQEKEAPEKIDFSSFRNLPINIQQQIFRNNFEYLTKNKNEFNDFSDKKQRCILGQLLCYQIDNLNEYLDHFKTLNHNDQQTQKYINTIQEMSLRIINLFIDPEIYSVEEIAELIKNPLNLIDTLINTAEMGSE